MLDMMRDFESIAKEDPNVTEMKTVDIDESTGMPTVFYIVSKIPMMSSRENLIKLDFSKVEGGEHAGKHFTITQSILRDDFPI